MADLLRRRSRRVLTALGLVLLVVPPVVWWSRQEAPDVGDLPAPPAQTAPSPTPSGGLQTGPDLPRRSGLLSQQGDVPLTAAPSVLRLPTIGVDADVVPVGIAPDGAMEIPSDVNQVGWYRFGPAPGDLGTAVLAGTWIRVRRIGAPSSTCGDSTSVTASSSKLPVWCRRGRW